jgi:hypothetical protein
MTPSRTQHVIPATIVLAVATIVAWLSFTQEPAEAFLFPRIISVAFLGLAIWNMARAALGLARVGGGIDRTTALNVLPGLAIALAFVFWGATALGFYVAGTITFLAVYTIYDPSPLTSASAWLRRIVVTAVFMAVIYGLFALLLRVQTPRGMFF